MSISQLFSQKLLIAAAPVATNDADAATGIQVGGFHFGSISAIGDDNAHIALAAGANVAPRISSGWDKYSNCVVERYYKVIFDGVPAANAASHWTYTLSDLDCDNNQYNINYAEILSLYIAATGVVIPVANDVVWKVFTDATGVKKISFAVPAARKAKFFVANNIMTFRLSVSVAVQ